MTIKNALPYILAAALAHGATPVCAAVPQHSSVSAAAQRESSGYDQPPKNILDVMHAPSLPIPNVSPTNDRILLVSWRDYPSIDRVARPFLRLAGVRIEPGNHSKHDTPGGYGITPCVRDLELVRISGGFTRLRQYRLLLLAGYAIIDDAAFPIVGDPKKAYDTYLEQLVADAKAAVDEAVRLGVVDTVQQAIRSDPRQRRHRPPGYSSSRAALVQRHGIERATRL